jgi:hypothetical protein
VPSGPAHRPREPRREVEAQAGDADVAFEPDGFRVERRRKAGRAQRPAAREGELRQPRIRPCGRVHGAIDGLEVLHAAVEAPAGPEPGQAQEAVEVGDAGAIRSQPEILEVQPVARIGEVRVEAQPVGEVGAVRERAQPAIAARHVVARQEPVGDLAAAAPGQVAELGVDPCAAPREKERLQRHVVVRREVEVVGQADLEAALVRVAERREQEAGLARVADREGDDRRVQDRHALERHAHVAAAALLRTLVDVHGRGAQEPVAVAGRAGREADCLEREVAARRHHELARGAARRAQRELELGAGEASAAARVPGAAGALEPQSGRAVLDVAIDLEALRRGVEGRGLRRQRVVALAHRDSAGERGVALARDLGGAARDLDRKFAVRERHAAVLAGGRRHRVGRRPRAFLGRRGREQEGRSERGDGAAGKHGSAQVYNASPPAVACA